MKGWHGASALCKSKTTFPQITSLVLIRNSQTSWLKFLLLGEAETAIRLVIKS